ncbi:MAG: lysylphosphatidylglycerol synthase transmembrane domain-containing protein [Gemmatimonadales bacterium]
MTSSTPSRRAPIWQTFVGIGISAALLYWSFRGTNWADIVTNIRTARLGPIVVGVVLATTTFVIRLFRWELLLRAPDGSKLPRLPLWHALAMGFMANNVLPFRMGEVVRTYAASKLTGVRFTAALASVGVERLFDALTVIALLAIGLLGARIPADTVVGGVAIQRIVIGASIVAIGGLIAGALVVAFPMVTERIITRLIPSTSLAARLVGIVEGIRMGLSVLRSPSRFAGVIGLSFAVWGVNALAFYSMLPAFGINIDPSGTLVMQGLIMFGVAVPAAPGFVGLFEAPIILVLGLYGIPRSLALTYALTYHITTFFPITLLGAWSVARTGLGLRQMGHAPE